MSKAIKLNNVRLSFPSLFKPAVFNGVEGKYEATFLIPKSDKAVKAQLDAAIKALLVENKAKVPADKICLKDGDESEYDGYAGNWSIKASNKDLKGRIRDRNPKVILLEDDGKIYAGCRVNAMVEFWFQNNNYGKRINANLLGVQFFEDDKPFGTGGSNVDLDNEFETFEELSDDFDELGGL